MISHLEKVIFDPPVPDSVRESLTAKLAMQEDALQAARSIMGAKVRWQYEGEEHLPHRRATVYIRLIGNGEPNPQEVPS